jgi:hypothetical protein
MRRLALTSVHSESAGGCDTGEKTEASAALRSTTPRRRWAVFESIFVDWLRALFSWGAEATELITVAENHLVTPS